MSTDRWPALVAGRRYLLAKGLTGELTAGERRCLYCRLLPGPIWSAPFRRGPGGLVVGWFGDCLGCGASGSGKDFTHRSDTHS